jgi:AhpD family alkylhydroperoxidase
MELAPEAYKHLLAMEQWMHASALPKTTYELVKIRVSQLNGCAFCIDMHTHDLRAMGETDERIFGLSAWDETPFYTDSERAALRLAEEGTKLTTGRVTDSAWAEARAHFDDQTITALVVGIALINAWNRFGTILQKVPGSLRKASATATA